MIPSIHCVTCRLLERLSIEALLPNAKDDPQAHTNGNNNEIKIWKRERESDGSQGANSI